MALAGAGLFPGAGPVEQPEFRGDLAHKRGEAGAEGHLQGAGERVAPGLVKGDGVQNYLSLGKLHLQMALPHHPGPGNIVSI